MARIIMGKSSKEVPDGSLLTEPCKGFGIIFGCGVGICGTCRVRVLEGMENLSEMTPEEKDFGLGKDERLACQCKIKKGVVRIESAFE